MRSKGDSFNPVHVIDRNGVYFFRIRGWKSGIYRTTKIRIDGSKDAEASAWKVAWEEFKKGEEIRTGTLTLGAYAAKFWGPDCPHILNLMAEGKGIQDRTAATNRGVVKNHLLPLQIMRIRVCDITKLHAEGAKRELVKKLGPSPIAVAAWSRFITILNTAYRDGMVARDPLLGVKPVRAKKTLRKAFSKLEIDKFLQRENFDSDMAFAVFKHTFLSGMRRSEILRFEWPQIQSFTTVVRDEAGKEFLVSRKKIVVDKAWKDNNNEVSGLPKWDKIREFPVSARLEAHLNWWKNLNPFDHCPLAYHTVDGKPLPLSWWNSSFNYAFSRAFPEEWARIQEEKKNGKRVKRSLVPHSLRHTWATDLSEAGMSDRAIQAAGGWSGPAVQSIYTHLDNAERLVASFDAVDRSLQGK